MRMYFTFIFLLPLCLLYFDAIAQVSQTSSKKICEIVLEDEIHREKCDSSIITKGIYTADNKIYRSGSFFVYDYYYQDLSGKKFKFTADEVTEDMSYEERKKAWHLVNFDSINDHTIDLITLSIDTNSNDILYQFPDFHQTIIAYDYILRDGSKGPFEGTGLIENEKNTWLHPPRNKLLGVLELNPFPFIQAPYEVGNKWSWTLNNIAGKSYGDERWKSWEGIIETISNYEIVGKRIMSTPIGELECFVIESTALSPFGKTYLTAYFNVDIGFVKLDYTNIDSTKLVLELLAHANQNN